MSVKLKRIGIDEKAYSLLSDAVSAMKLEKDYIKVNESRLASEIIKVFFKKQFKKELPRLEKLFYSKKEVLKHILKKAQSEEEIEESLSQFFNKTK